MYLPPRPLTAKRPRAPVARRDPSKLRTSLRGLGFAEGRAALQLAPGASELHPDHQGDPDVGYRDYGDTLFVRGISGEDVVQGAAGDCYFLAALSSVAAARPEHIRGMIRRQPPGFLVRFYRRVPSDDGPSRFVEHWQPVTRMLPGRSGSRRPLYAQSEQWDNDSHQLELWPAIVEKAWADWKGGYDDIGQGGVARQALEAIAGREAERLDADGESAGLFVQIAVALHERRAVTVGTRGGSAGREERQLAAGLYPGHEYSVVRAHSDGRRPLTITLRNPWGRRYEVLEAPEGADDDAIFEVPWTTFQQLFDHVDIQGR